MIFPPTVLTTHSLALFFAVSPSQGDSERFIVHERPFVREFLRSLKKLPLEVVIFTAGIQVTITRI